ncbi:DsbA family protein [Brucella pituitosa]|uniref:DsbA family protein n=1 Tax=Brucella pituitosa TaxID=571256 RepID=UPI0009A1835C|nr:DsbA family protein [Brucella pituitosa]
MMNRRQMLATTVAGAATIAISGGESFAQRVPTVADVLYDKEIPVLGNPNGNVTIVEYFDYQCPYCKKGHAELMSVVEKDGNVRLVLKDWIIFGDNSAYPARLVLAAEKSGNYVKAMEAMMLTPGRLTKDQTDAALKKGGLDPKKLEADYKADAARIDGILARNMEQGEAFNFGGTPSFVIGTRLYGGVMNERSLIDAIKEARKA